MPTHPHLTYQIIGAAMRVHRNTPRGLREKHYQRALTLELQTLGLNTIEEHSIAVHDSQNQWLGNLRLDHWVNDCIVVEDKAFTRNLVNKELAPIIAYLAATQAPSDSSSTSDAPASNTNASSHPKPSLTSKAGSHPTSGNPKRQSKAMTKDLVEETPS